MRIARTCSKYLVCGVIRFLTSSQLLNAPPNLPIPPPNIMNCCRSPTSTCKFEFISIEVMKHKFRNNRNPKNGEKDARKIIKHIFSLEKNIHTASAYKNISNSTLYSIVQFHFLIS